MAAASRPEKSFRLAVLAVMIAGACTFLSLYCTQPLLPYFQNLFHASEFGVSLTVSAATLAVEELMLALAGRYTILVVTHNMAQARRVSKECAFMLMGEVIEYDRTEQLFLTPRDSRTADYVEGRYG